MGIEQAALRALEQLVIKTGHVEFAIYMLTGAVITGAVMIRSAIAQRSTFHQLKGDRNGNGD